MKATARYAAAAAGHPGCLSEGFSLRRLDVERGGPAAAVGLRPGDIVIGVNGEPVASAAELRERLGRPGSRVALNLLRGEVQLLIVVE
jgi:S1-C subfamily serine protease